MNWHRRRALHRSRAVHCAALTLTPTLPRAHQIPLITKFAGEVSMTTTTTSGKTDTTTSSVNTAFTMSTVVPAYSAMNATGTMTTNFVSYKQDYKVEVRRARWRLLAGWAGHHSARLAVRGQPAPAHSLTWPRPARSRTGHIQLLRGRQFARPH